MLRAWLPAVLLCVAGPVLAQAAPAALPRVAMETDKGRIVIEIDSVRAPVTAANFLRYVDTRRYDGIAFYRAMTITPADGLIQGGMRTDGSRMLPPIAHEPTSRTGLSHTDGAIAMAHGGPGTARSDFYIVVGDLRGLDARPDDPGYAVFGRVVEGLDVVRLILAAPKSPTEGADYGMQGQILEPLIRIVSARRAPAPAPAL